MAAYNPADPFQSGGGSPYDALRDKVKRNAGNDQAQGMDAITRRFAAMGNLNSGSYIKAQEELNRQGTQNAQDALGNIDVAEAGQALPYKQLQQQGDQFEKQLAEQKSEFGQEMPLKSRALDLEARKLNLEAGADEWNKYLGSEQLSRTGGLFGGGGFLGTGIKF